MLFIFCFRFVLFVCVDIGHTEKVLVHVSLTPFMADMTANLTLLTSSGPLKYLASYRLFTNYMPLNIFSIPCLQMISFDCIEIGNA